MQGDDFQGKQQNWISLSPHFTIKPLLGNASSFLKLLIAHFIEVDSIIKKAGGLLELKSPPI